MIAIGTLIVDVFFTFPLIMAPVYELLELSLFEAPATTQDLEGGIQGEVILVLFYSFIQSRNPLLLSLKMVTFYSELVLTF
jgi:hypothetical protein